MAHGEIELNVTLRRLDEVLAKHFGRRGSSTILLEESDGGQTGLAADRRKGAGIH